MPTIEIAGKQIETTEMGYLVNAEDWSEDLAKAIASQEKLDLTDEEERRKHILEEMLYMVEISEKSIFILNKVLKI